MLYRLVWLLPLASERAAITGRINTVSVVTAPWVLFTHVCRDQAMRMGHSVAFRRVGYIVLSPPAVW